MGATRKILSLSTLGLVRWHSAGERAAIEARRTRREVGRLRRELRRRG
ncbi:MAG TPA: hypothetical protein VHV82_02550 [Sporichthyaceae bacterium]|jgi:hypothetical protein|nr:hypothetical protein [Sporichthyaceae bacterium]